MNTHFPRLVTNGTYFRIETAPGVFEQDYCEYGGQYDWQTKSRWIARRKFRYVLRKAEYEESIKPEKWVPVDL